MEISISEYQKILDRLVHFKKPVQKQLPTRMKHELIDFCLEQPNRRLTFDELIEYSKQENCIIWLRVYYTLSNRYILLENDMYRFSEHPYEEDMNSVQFSDFGNDEPGYLRREYYGIGYDCYIRKPNKEE